ncbi:sugar ABC transporter substrate-binding protein [Arthrobacter sp. 35W]|uniref:sugar ABC transporter substrate-binding protein n=1 Tax=Arthrobacter sp. 35W TaxID=1132441 RepID=UPI00041BA7FF|nr:extracellular solute-binding protein [Arthrobacter sp. 35W]
MKRKLLAATSLLAAGALFLAGCSTSSPNSAPAIGSEGSGTGTVNLLGSEDPTTFAPVIAAFKTKNPDITVKYAQVPFDQLNPTLQQRLGAKDDTIDLYTVDQPRLSQLAAQGFLEDLSTLKEQTKAAVPDAQYSVNLYQDKLWALPVWNSTQLMFFNKKSLDAAGIAYPSIDPAQRMTWEQIAKDGKAAQAAGTQFGLLLEQVEAYYQLQPLAESLGGGSGITGDKMLTTDITNTGWEKAMQWYSDTFSSGLSPRGVGGFQTSPLFTSGKVAYFVGGPWDIGNFAKSDIDWGVAPMPYFAGGSQATPTGSWSWGINPASKNKAAAKKFLEFASLDPAGNLATTDATTIIPANTAATAHYLPKLEALGGAKTTGLANLIAHENTQTATPRPVSVGYIQFEELMGKAFADIRNGSPVDERLKQATQQINDAWKQL